ncbi:MAG: UDP-N-acetylmuramoyl-L-alanyl-D-glutamate--2,6-diaminopimelate ligase [Clostridia bacterium]|nr:UDP-N-acetylmuramoyl-L-alanyl-D-glutamate--2,6-diaminopimelate ligase [Clostridia bacterium]
MLLYTLLRDVEITRTNVADLSVQAGSIVEHSDRLEPGCIFVCVPGIRHDGHDYIDRAICIGASLIVAERMTEELLSSGAAYILVPNARRALCRMWSAYYGNPERALRLFAVTGTNGKSSTAYVLRSILQAAGEPTGLIGSIKNEFGSLVLPDSPMTTPEPETLYGILASMRDAGARSVVLEASSHALAMGRLYGVTFDVGIYTNLSPEHLDFHTDMAEYARAKARLFSQSRVGVVNADDSRAHIMSDGASWPIRTYSARGRADYSARDIRYPAQGGVAYYFTSRKEMFFVESPLRGTFSVYNTLAAASAAYEWGIGGEHIVNGIRDLRVIPGRLERVENCRDIDIYIDYAHTPAALEAVICEVRRYARGRVILLMGCGGMRDKSKRPFMGRVASELCELTVITTDNPRGEDPDEIIAQIVSGIDGGKVAIVRDREEAIAYALSEAVAGDTLLFAGKGHEDYQILADRVIPFSDREMILKYLK